LISTFTLRDKVKGNLDYSSYILAYVVEGLALYKVDGTYIYIYLIWHQSNSAILIYCIGWRRIHHIQSQGKKYNIANTSCHFGSYGSIYGPVRHHTSVHIIFCWWRTGPYTAIWPFKVGMVLTLCPSGSLTKDYLPSERKFPALHYLVCPERALNFDLSHVQVVREWLKQTLATITILK
jgi:hypothetical protein